MAGGTIEDIVECIDYCAGSCSAEPTNWILIEGYCLNFITRRESGDGKSSCLRGLSFNVLCHRIGGCKTRSILVLGYQQFPSHYKRGGILSIWVQSG